MHQVWAPSMGPCPDSGCTRRPAQEEASCSNTAAHARYVWNLTVEQHSHWYKGPQDRPGFRGKQCRQLTEGPARQRNGWGCRERGTFSSRRLQGLRPGQGTLGSRPGFGEPTWRKKHVTRGPSGSSAPTRRGRSLRRTAHRRLKREEPAGKIMGPLGGWRNKLNRRWAQGEGARLRLGPAFRLTRGDLPKAKDRSASPGPQRPNGTFAFAVIPEPIDGPRHGRSPSASTGGVTITAALSDGRKLNCPAAHGQGNGHSSAKHQRRAARAPKGSRAQDGRVRQGCTAQGPGIGPTQGTGARKTQHDCSPRTYDPGAIREAHHQEHGRARRRGTVEQPGKKRTAEGRTEPGHPSPKAWGLPPANAPSTRPPGESKDVPAPLHQACDAAPADGFDKNSRKSQARILLRLLPPSPATRTPTQQTNVAAGTGRPFPAPGRSAGAGGVTTATGRSSAREPQPI